MAEHETDDAATPAGGVEHRETPAPEWMGNRLARDEDLVDELLERHDGDQAAAEHEFDELSDEAEEYDRQHDQGAGNQPWAN